MDDIAALRLERFGLHENFERSLGAETRHSFGKLKVVVCGPMHYDESSSSRRFSQLSTVKWLRLD
jgi:hypothetical protein